MRRDELKRTPDWAAMIDQLMARGITLQDIGVSMQFSIAITDRMLRHYREGVQPLHYRGEGLMKLWCRELRKKREQAPQMDLVRGHRVERREPDTSPRVQNLPPFPVAPEKKFTTIVRPRKGKRAVPA